MQYDIAIVGAGIAGLICAQRLHQAGYSVVLCDKSRGLGGRLATRRLAETQADHGLCYFKPKGDLFRAFVQDLCDRQILKLWTHTIHTLDVQGSLQPVESHYYASPTGATAVAKFLAQGLSLELNQRIVQLELIASSASRSRWWRLTSEQGTVLTANAVVVAIPAPQAAELLANSGDTWQDTALLTAVQGIEFSPCVTAIAAYPPAIQSAIAELNLQGIICLDDPILGWIGFDSTKLDSTKLDSTKLGSTKLDSTKLDSPKLDSPKQANASQPAMIIQSNGRFAAEHFAQFDPVEQVKDLPNALEQMGKTLCDRAATLLNVAWISHPEVRQVHRWRYAFALNPRPEKFLAASTPIPLLCTGDWCGGDRAESAFLAGLATAAQVQVVMPIS